MAVVIEGQAELMRAFRGIDKGLAKEMRTVLRETAKPTQQLAQGRALGEIRNMTSDWSRLRMGVTQREVYLVPKQKGGKYGRRRNRRRPNLVGLMTTRALEPAVNQNTPQITRSLEVWLDSLAARQGF